MSNTKASGGAATTNGMAVPLKRAFSYLRVSSEGQVNTGYDRDGLSINAQREAANDKAEQLQAEIVREFSDPGRSAFVDLHKRVEFLEMLDELKQLNQREATKVDFVIVWALNRWARNVEDHHHTRRLVKETGAKLISITEPMVGEDNPESFYMEGMFALNNQYESMKTGRNVARGIYQKAKSGGTYGLTRLGYLNQVERLPDGRQVASVSHDPNRAPFISTAFKLYATGEYSLSQLANELYDLGLRTRQSRKRQARKLGTSALQRLLRDPYYAGWIVYKRGTPDEQVFQGRHEPLVDEVTFDTVQALLDEKRVAGERPQKHHHYLKGSIYCAECGKRLVYGVSTGKTGAKYAYFFCSGRINRTGCQQRVNMPPVLIEEAVERYYAERPVELTPKDVKKRTAAIQSLVAVSQKAVLRVKQVKADLIADLKDQQIRLLRLHAEEGDSISPDAFRDERVRMQQEIEAAEKSLAATEERLQLDADMLRMALELAGDVARVYADADPATKRGYNQAFFRKLKIQPAWDDEQSDYVPRVVNAELTEPYALLLADGFAEQVVAEANFIQALSAPTENGPVGPPSENKTSNFDLVSNFESLAEREGFEPSRGLAPP